MDDEATFGPEFHWLSFGSAVDNGLLTDYRVLALAISEDMVSEVYQRVMAAEDGFEIPDAAKIIGCWKGLLSQGDNTYLDGVTGFADDGPKLGEGRPLQNAVAFCSTIAESKRISDYFERTVDAYLAYEREEKGIDLPEYRCTVHHVDGSINAKVRKDELEWLATSFDDPDECRVLTNAKCLAEGIDVPNLDAVMFLQPKKSQIDIVQAVGRVMRRFEGKKLGYIILPVVIPSGMTPVEALDDNEAYAAVWQVLKALRSHDERLDAKINALPYDKPGSDGAKADLGGVVDLVDLTEEERENEQAAGFQGELALEWTAQEFQEGVRAVIVKKCGTKIYWDLWARDIAEIAKRHIERIGEIVRDEPDARERFATFLRGLRDSLNESITDEQAIEMLAQHVITLPVFEALFGGGFATSNPVSIAMEDMIQTIRRFELETPEEARELGGLYASVRMRAEGVRTDAGRQQIIKDLYENFFRYAFKATSEAMGVVYTPRQVVSYILHFTNRILQQEFGQTFADKDVHILDPFTGTGTFIVDLIEDEGLIPAEALPYKYANEIHCNEILLLAYYIATINIETAYHNRMVKSADCYPGRHSVILNGAKRSEESPPSQPEATGDGGDPSPSAQDDGGGMARDGEVAYIPFEGAVLTDTFQMYEVGDPIDVEMFVDNTERVLRQMETPVKVVIGNPPYSVGQKAANDDNANEKYPTLARRVREKYVIGSRATNNNAVYNSYIEAFRWATDRIGEKGIVAFVSGAGWLDGPAFDRFRECLCSEFNSIWILNLRGNKEFRRLSREQLRLEGDNIFGSGSKSPIAITLLVKNPDSDERGIVRYYDIGDSLSREDKLNIVNSAIRDDVFDWRELHIDQHGDWFNQRDESYDSFAPLALNKYKAPFGIFETWSNGNKTQRDAWAVNYSRDRLGDNMHRLVNNYNSEVEEHGNTPNAYELMDKDPTRINWTRRLQEYASKGLLLEYDGGKRVLCNYRPFCKQWMYYDSKLNEMTYQQPRLFPMSNGEKAERTYQQPNLFSIAEGGKRRVERDDIPATSPLMPSNLVICAASIGSNRTFSCLILDELPCLDLIDKSQCFPLYWYKDGIGDSKHRREAITDEALGVFRAAYPNEYATRPKSKGGPHITKEDIFYYIYGVLHSPEYRSRFEANLKKELPRIPLARDFREFAQAGRSLADLHLNYETVEPYPLEVVGDERNAGPVQKMKWGKRTDPATKKKVDDHSVLIYNKNLTFKGIPEAADDYVVNGRTPLEWMIDRYQVKTDKASGIVNDPNEYSDDAMYIIDLVKRLVTVSVKTMGIVNALPDLCELDKPADWPFAWNGR